jgi:enolase-phosphatase E1
VSARAAPTAVQALLLDIEGTTTPIAFVHEVLFGYARTHLRQHLEQHATSAEYRALFEQLHDEHAADRRAGAAVPPWPGASPAVQLGAVASYAEWLMDHDRKSTPLKTLQGRIWEEGYRRGELAGEVFADVPAALERWHAAGVAIGIFSSGSALAQQLLFRHSTAGDLSRLLRWFFDTTVGAKSDRQSYRRIATLMGLPAETVWFISDVISELDAARNAGMQTRLSVRPGNQPPPSSHGHTVIHSFDELA